MPASTISRPKPVLRVKRDILPIYTIQKIGRSKARPLSYEGTGFLIAPGVLVTCWHCVSAKLPRRHNYAVCVEGEQVLHDLTQIEQDPSGLDLATAAVDMPSTLCLPLGTDNDALQGLELMTYGYPLGAINRQPDGLNTISVPGRLLRGYITRRFTSRLAGYGATPTIELDMPAPAGLSGAPLIVPGMNRVMGIVYGANAVAQVEEQARVDPLTGIKEPEIHRIVTFAAAHTPGSLRKLCGAATRGKPLGELLPTSPPLV